MTILEAYDHLVAELAARFTGAVQDNLVDKPVSFPCVVVEMEGSRLSEHGGGSIFTGEHEFVIWVICAYGGSFRSARESLTGIVEPFLDIPRFYTGERVEYGVDMVWDKRCVLAKLSGKVG